MESGMAGTKTLLDPNRAMSVSYHQATYCDGEGAVVSDSLQRVVPSRCGKQLWCAQADLNCVWAGHITDMFLSSADSAVYTDATGVKVTTDRDWLWMYTGCK